MNSSYQQLIRNLEYLKLKQMIIHLNETIDFSTKNELPFVETLVKLTNYEIDTRERNMIHSMVKVGAFPHLKELKDFDFDFQPSINKQQIFDFTTLRFIEEKENIVFLGPSGVGKTHLATAIGIAAAKKKNEYVFYQMP
ncbi:DNA replication protein DnaC [Anoxybacillus calidus]|jgi:DNA replication protein DnaC|uniref:DNA replication protein DnaC n=1 Tax=[Anoxybacillus] calidus TaxID=575178 RepID=A0A7V9Z0I6_9BACL|nr:ATP-binding protein [Anoxybacillus calidus]MBA2871874.1 DNA replication protein DnaC [Anoxybacillus calidus]